MKSKKSKKKAVAGRGTIRAATAEISRADSGRYKAAAKAFRDKVSKDPAAARKALRDIGIIDAKGKLTAKYAK